MGLMVTKVPSGIMKDQLKIHRRSHVDPDDSTQHSHNPDGSLKRELRHIWTGLGRMIPIPQFEENRQERGGQVILEPGGAFLLDLQTWPSDLRKPMQDDLVEGPDGSWWRITLSMYSDVLGNIRTVRID